MDEVSLVIPHQANKRIIQTAARRLRLPEEKVYVNLDRYGNTSSASIPIALCEAIEEGRVEAGDNLVLVGFGAGLTWAAAVVQWAAPWPVTPQTRQQRVVRRTRRGFARIRSAWRRARRRLWGALRWVQRKPDELGTEE
jgi:3-oxoacyl-[acyl-carrier-protein] synthase-3